MDEKEVYFKVDNPGVFEELKGLFKGSEFEVTLSSIRVESMSGHITNQHSVKIERKQSNEKTTSTK